MSLSFNYSVIKHFGTISKKGSRLKVLNYISYDGRPPVYDLRVWETTEKGTQMHKGITLTEEELLTLHSLITGIVDGEERQGITHEEPLRSFNSFEPKRWLREDDVSSRPGG